MERNPAKLTAFGREVKKRLIDKDMTQAELADLLGCSRQYLNNILHGRKSGGRHREMIAEIVGIEMVACGGGDA